MPREPGQVRRLYYGIAISSLLVLPPWALLQWAMGGAFGIASFSGKTSGVMSHLATTGLVLSALFFIVWTVAFIGLLALLPWARRLAIGVAVVSLIDAMLWGALWASWPSTIPTLSSVLVIGWSVYTILALNQSFLTGSMDR